VSGVGKTIFFGGFSLLTFFTIFVGLGVTVLGVRVSFGVLTGELNAEGSGFKFSDLNKIEGSGFSIAEQFEMMMGKKKKGGDNDDDNNPFGY